jgi:mono/diheme cytochrome c family protein
METLVLTVLLSSVVFAADPTANLYRAKCSPCHGKNGERKPSMKAPSLVSDEAKKMSDQKIRELIAARANGEMDRNPSHTNLKKRLTKDQVEQIIVEIRKLQESQH